MGISINRAQQIGRRQAHRTDSVINRRSDRALDLREICSRLIPETNKRRLLEDLAILKAGNWTIPRVVAE